MRTTIGGEIDSKANENHHQWGNREQGKKRATHVVVKREWGDRCSNTILPRHSERATDEPAAVDFRWQIIKRR